MPSGLCSRERNVSRRGVCSLRVQHPNAGQAGYSKPSSLPAGQNGDSAECDLENHSLKMAAPSVEGAWVLRDHLEGIYRQSRASIWKLTEKKVFISSEPFYVWHCVMTVTLTDDDVINVDVPLTRCESSAVMIL